MKLLLNILLIITTLSGAAQEPLSAVVQKTDVLCDKGKADITVTGGTQPYTLAWSTGQTGTAIANLNAGAYSVHVTDALNKDTTIYFSIEESPCPVGISNHFTPNGDGYNDTWSITNIARYPNFELTVFNRWGQMVHHQQGIYIPWNGTQHGLDLPDAGYYYIFYFEKGNRNSYLKGDVSILR